MNSRCLALLSYVKPSCPSALPGAKPVRAALAQHWVGGGVWSRCGVVHRSVPLTQQTESEAKTKVNNRDGGGAEEGAFVVELKSSTSWII
ncbi:4518_t:CDS:1, partial [Paraglomus brasilianum]